jgi:hypothetical protein
MLNKSKLAYRIYVILIANSLKKYRNRSEHVQERALLNFMVQVE